jgi:hypothetical protein
VPSGLTIFMPFVISLYSSLQGQISNKVVRLENTLFIKENLTIKPDVATKQMKQRSTVTG